MAVGIAAFMAMALFLVVHAVMCFRQTPEAEPPLCLEQSGEMLVTTPKSPDVTWTKRAPAESPNPPQCAQLRDGPLSGELCANDSELSHPNTPGNLSGFRSFQHALFPKHNIFRVSGFNFEHILSGRAKDSKPGTLGNFAPRNEPSMLSVHSESSASIFWPASNSCWGVSSEMRFSLDHESHVDLVFRTALQTAPDADYLLYMWANYVQGVRAKTIQFWGARNLDPAGLTPGNGIPGWVSLDGTPQSGLSRSKQGIIRFLGMPALTVEQGVDNLNYWEYGSCAFLLPFFFGVMDGDGDSSTAQDDMAYIMMFDQAEQIRFIMWDFSNGAGEPVWDWQYVVRKPQPAQTYGYRARLVYKPYAGPEDVVAEYVKWTKSLGGPVHRLKIGIVPPESAVLFPANSEGMYGDNVHVYFGINPSPGWRFDHWEGDAIYKRRGFTQILMNGDKAVRAVCRRIE